MGSVRYKVLIVEDETYIRNSLVRLIDWESIDCVVVNSCESGEEAQEYIRTNEVDIVVSDIRMEGMSGLDLAKAIKDHNPMIKIIFLTGYAEFEYARSAVKLTVTDFILKPTNPDELKNAVCRAIEEIERNKQREDLLATLTKQVKENIPRLRSQFLYDLLYGTMIASEINARASFLGIPETPYYILLCSLDDYNVLLTQRDEAELQIIRLGLYQKALEYDEAFVWGAILDTHTFIFCFHGEYPDRYAGIIKAKAEDIFCVSLSIGISGPSLRIIHISEEFSKARAALRYRFYSGPGSITFYNDISTSPGDSKEYRMMHRPNLDEIEDAIEAGDGIHAVEALETICRSISDIPCEQTEYVKTIFAEIFLLMQRTAIKHGIAFSMYDTFTDVLRKDTLREVRTLTTDRIRHLCASILEQNKTNRKRTVTKIIAYLNENYKRKITLDEVSKAVYKSPKYICRLLKQETGKHFSDILLSIRMEKAHTLLRETDKSVSEISSMVGINDPQYFSKVFKKYYNISPTEYRIKL